MPTATDFKDYYAILFVSKTSTPEEIKRAYRKFARKYHPDLNPGDKDVEAKFKDLNLVGAAMVLDMAQEIAQLRAQINLYQAHPLNAL